MAEKQTTTQPKDGDVPRPLLRRLDQATVASLVAAALAGMVIYWFAHGGHRGEQQHCARCQRPFAPKLQIDDLITTERQLGYDYRVGDGRLDHYQRICPICRRAMLGVAQGMLATPERAAEPLVDLSGIEAESDR